MNAILQDRGDAHGPNLQCRGPHQPLDWDRASSFRATYAVKVLAHPAKRLVQQLLEAAQRMTLRYRRLQRYLTEHSVLMNVGFAHHIGLFRCVNRSSHGAQTFSTAY